MSKGKPKFDTGAVAKKFLSGVPEETSGDNQDKSAAANKPVSDNSYIPIGKEIGENRPKSVDKKTGEVTKQIGYFVTVSQDKKLGQIAMDLNTNKSALVREAIRMYFDFLKREDII